MDQATISPQKWFGKERFGVATPRWFQVEPITTAELWEGLAFDSGSAVNFPPGVGWGEMTGVFPRVVVAGEKLVRQAGPI